MIAKKALIIDNNITNSDWTKANAFDFPGVKTVQDFELQFGVPASEPARSERLTELKKYPWAKATPRPIHDLLFYDLFQKMSLIDLIKASFAGDRSAAGRYAANMRWKGHKKDVTAPKQARDLTEELKTYFGTNTEEYKKSQGYKDLRQKLIDKQSKGTGIGDLQLEIIADKQGFSGLPRVVSSAEMDQLEKDGWTIAYRGIADSYFDDMIEFRAEKLAEQFRTGEYFAGVGTSGNGIYFAKDRMTAESYAGNVEVNVLGGIAYRSTRKVPQGVVIKVAIPPGALMTEVQFRQELSKQKDLYTGSGFNGEWHGESDVGRKLAAKGTKGVELKLSFGLGADRESAFLVWDRSMLAVEESTQTK